MRRAPHESRNARRRPHRRGLRRGAALLAEAGLHQLRRAGRADRHHAHRTGRAAPLDQRAAFPACAELLHAAARPRGAATGDLHRLAAAPHGRRHRCRAAVRAALAGAADPAVVAVPHDGSAPGRGRAVLRHQTGRDRDRAARRMAHRFARTEQPLDVGHRRRVLRRDLRAARALPGHRRGGRAGGRARRALRAPGVPGRRRAWRGGRTARGRVDRRRHADAAACPLQPRPAGPGAVRRSAAVAGADGAAGGLGGMERHLCADGLVLHQGGAAHLRRRLCGAALCGAGRGGALRLAESRHR